jgi:aryl-alcohol dehydrogenase-like predicted oxidoreductase
MMFRRLGRTGLQVSEISLGTVELGIDYGIRTGSGPIRPTEEEAHRLLNRALDLGVNFIDTAAAYGTSEEIIGRALGRRRSSYYIATKCLHYYDETDAIPEIRRRMEASIDESLRRLKTDAIDLIQVHGRDRQEIEQRMIREGEVIEVLERARQAGKVRFIGYSSYSEEASLAIIEDGRWDTLQIPYNILDQRGALRVFPAARASRVGVIVRSALLKGALTDKAQHLPSHLKPLMDRTEQLKALTAPGMPTLPQVALRFVLSNPDVSTIIVGADRIPYLDEAVSVSDGCGLPGEVLIRAQELKLDDPDLLNPGRWGIP